MRDSGTAEKKIQIFEAYIYISIYRRHQLSEANISKTELNYTLLILSHRVMQFA